MKSFITSLLLLLLTYIADGQRKKKEFFEPNVRGIENVIDSLPHFMFEKAELDTLILWNLVFPPEAEYWGVNSIVKLKFSVDSAGNTGDFKVIDYDLILNPKVQVNSEEGIMELKKKYVSESIRIIKLTNGLWASKKVGDQNKNPFLIYQIKFFTELYDKNSKDYQDEKDRMKKGMYSGLFVYTFGDPQKSSLKMQSLYNVGVRKLEANKLQLATVYFEEAIKYNDRDKDAIYNLGICYYKMGKNDEACKFWKKAADLGDKDCQSLLEQKCH